MLWFFSHHLHSATPPHQDQKLGIGMKTTGGVTAISAITDDGVFAKSPIKVGMEVKTVNNNKVLSSSQAISMLKEATGQITIVADDEPSTSPPIAVASAAAPATTASHHPGDSPPPGVASGGQWGTNKYQGSNTQALACLGCLCFCLPGLCVLLCPIDERDAYKSEDGKVYDAAGMCLGGGGVNFVPKKSTMQR